MAPETPGAVSSEEVVTVLARRIRPDELPASRRGVFRGGAVAARHAAPRGGGPDSRDAQPARRTQDIQRARPDQPRVSHVPGRDGRLPSSGTAPRGGGDGRTHADGGAHGTRGRRARRPSVGPRGQVRWWDRPAPGGDEELWHAVVRCHEALQRRGWTVSDLARRLARRGYPVRRETLSRVLNGRQHTSWSLVEAIAEVLDVEV